MTGRIIWRAPLNWSTEQQLAIVAWLQAHHVETRTIAKRAVVTAGEQPQIHLAVYQTNADGHRYADWTTDLAATLPLVVPCRFRPPSLGGILDEQLAGLPPVPHDSAHLDPQVGGTEGGIARHLAAIGWREFTKTTADATPWESASEVVQAGWIDAARAICRTVDGWYNAPQRIVVPPASRLSHATEAYIPRDTRTEDILRENTLPG